jgi:hypothetical protein
MQSRLRYFFLQILQTPHCPASIRSYSSVGSPYTHLGLFWRDCALIRARCSGSVLYFSRCRALIFSRFLSAQALLVASTFSRNTGSSAYRCFLRSAARDGIEVCSWIARVGSFGPTAGMAPPPPARAERAASEAGRGRIAVLSGSDGCEARPSAAYAAAAATRLAGAREAQAVPPRHRNDQRAIVENTRL